MSLRRAFPPPETPAEIRAAAQRAARHRQHDTAREQVNQQLIELITTISAADLPTAHAAVRAMASGRAGSVELVEHLHAHPDALRSGSSAAPASLLRLALALHEAGVSGLVLPRCVDCNRASTRLDRGVAGGRLCGPCANARAAGPCRICGQTKPAVSRDATGAPICNACRTKQDSNIKACGLFQPAQDPGWLFPGANPGRPISPTSLAVQLRRGGVHTGTARPAALLHLATTMSAAVVADLLGISIHTATQRTATTGLSWARYVGIRTTTSSIRRPSNN